MVLSRATQFEQGLEFMCTPRAHSGTCIVAFKENISALQAAKERFRDSFCLKKVAVSLHAHIKDFFLSTTYSWQDADALCDVLYTELRRNACKNWKTTAVFLNVLFHLIQPTSHYEPQGASFLRPPRCQQLEEMFTPMPLGSLWKHWHDIHSLLQQKQHCGFVSRLLGSCHKQEKAHVFWEKS